MSIALGQRMIVGMRGVAKARGYSYNYHYGGGNNYGNYYFGNVMVMLEVNDVDVEDKTDDDMTITNTIEQIIPDMAKYIMTTRDALKGTTTTRPVTLHNTFHALQSEEDSDSDEDAQDDEYTNRRAQYKAQMNLAKQQRRRWSADSRRNTSNWHGHDHDNYNYNHNNHNHVDNEVDGETVQDAAVAEQVFEEDRLGIDPAKQPSTGCGCHIASCITRIIHIFSIAHNTHINNNTCTTHNRINACIHNHRHHCTHVYSNCSSEVVCTSSNFRQSSQRRGVNCVFSAGCFGRN